ncbi:hypothetical protein GWK47_028117 [Chionoecetes opilio]|uniref:K Homology domain-containing protein n=1 Tax=Chionoecetes opilio TaxID=41210 RepID=A0A8J5D3P0_CHIOP|nr:hypothetical protein GWK47_028117 [Chionoecetes opilio]
MRRHVIGPRGETVDKLCQQYPSLVVHVPPPHDTLSQEVVLQGLKSQVSAAAKDLTRHLQDMEAKTREAAERRRQRQACVAREGTAAAVAGTTTTTASAVATAASIASPVAATTTTTTTTTTAAATAPRQKCSACHSHDNHHHDHSACQNHCHNHQCHSHYNRHHHHGYSPQLSTYTNHTPGYTPPTQPAAAHATHLRHKPYTITIYQATRHS